jgi:surface protein
MFNFCRNLYELDLSSFNIINVTNMSNIFLSCANLTKLDLSSFNTKDVTKMSNETWEILSNEEVIAVNQDKLGE